MRRVLLVPNEIQSMVGLLIGFQAHFRFFSHYDIHKAVQGDGGWNTPDLVMKRDTASFGRKPQTDRREEERRILWQRRIKRASRERTGRDTNSLETRPGKSPVANTNPW